MIPKRFEDIEFADLEALLNNQVAEGKTIEYKEIIPSNADKDKVKFLAGVSAFANTNGGDFIIGIKAKDGIPINLVGIKSANLDEEVLRLEQMLQNSLEPRIPSFNIRDDIQSPTGERFIIIRANKSWIAPHKVKLNKEFYGRNSKGKYPLDVSELRTSFMLTEQLSERIKNFRLERIENIRNKHEVPVSLINGGKIILHSVPLTSFTIPTEFDVIELRKKAQFESTSAHHESKVNLEGVVIAPYFEKVTTSYTQVFRNGRIEKVICLNSLDGIIEYDKDYSSRYDEEQIIQSVSDFINFYSELGVDTPIYLFLTIVNVKDYVFHIDDAFKSHIEIRRKTAGNNQFIFFERNNIEFPEIIINSLNQLSEEILRPTFNLIWNSVGLTRDFNYDKSGKWIDDLRSLNRYKNQLP